jgi:hypothetical protein
VIQYEYRRDEMKTVVKGKYVGGVIRLPEGFKLDEDADVYLIVEEKKEKNLLEETFGIWIDEPDYLEKLREESETRIKAIGIT